MSQARDLIGVALNGLTGRKTRTLMIMLGPIIGVAAMVCAIGLTESAKGQLQSQLAQLGTNLIIAQAGGTPSVRSATAVRPAPSPLARMHRRPARTG